MSWLALWGWTIACYLGLSALVMALGAWRGGPLDLITLGAAQALVFTTCTLLVLRVHERNAALRPALGMRPTHTGLLLSGAALGLALKLPLEALTNRIEIWFPNSDAEILMRAELFRTERWLDVLGLLLVLCVVAPLVEEMFFRGALFGRLARSSPLAAGLGSSIAFVIVHPNPRHFLPLALVSAALGYLRVLSGSLLPCLSLHVTFNAAGVLTLVTGWASPMRPLAIHPLLLALSWAGVAAALWISTKLSQKPDVVRARSEDQA